MSAGTSGPVRELDDGPIEGRRRRGSRMLGRRAVLVSTASTIVFFLVIALVISLSPGASIVRERFFDWEHLRQAFTGTASTPSVLDAFVSNIRMFMIAEAFILVIALVIAVVRG